MHAKTQEGQTSNGSRTCVPTEPVAQQTIGVGEGEVITIEIDEEEEDLQVLIIAEEDEGMEVNTQPTNSVTKLPTYVPPRKGKAKVPKDLDETKSSLQTLLLPDGIMF